MITFIPTMCGSYCGTPVLEIIISSNVSTILGEKTAATGESFQLIGLM
jgi:hypothetical protein